MTPDRERDEASQISAEKATIRAWADEHDAMPYRHTEDGRYHLLTEAEAGDRYERVDWDEFNSHVEEENYVVIYHGKGTDEPFEVSDRERAISRSNVSSEDLEERLIEGETVTSTVTETTVIEEVIVEEATIESELVDTEIRDDRVVDVELLSRECSNCSLVDTGSVAASEWFDDDRYVQSVGQPGTVGRSVAPHGETTSSDVAATETATADTETKTRETERAMEAIEVEYPYSAEFDVEEVWAVTREFTERFTVESRITNVDVEESDTLEERDIDVEGLQRTIAESNLLDLDHTSDELLEEYEVETEFQEDDAIWTHFSRSHVVEDEIVDRRHVRAEVTEAELGAFERVETSEVATETTGEATTDTSVKGEGAAGVDEEVVPLSQDEVGKDVVDAAGEKIGMVTDVAEDGTRMYVDAHPGIAERIKAALDWGGADDDDYPVELEQIDHVTRDEIQLKGAEELDEMMPSA